MIRSRLDAIFSHFYQTLYVPLRLEAQQMLVIACISGISGGFERFTIRLRGYNSDDRSRGVDGR